MVRPPAIAALLLLLAVTHHRTVAVAVDHAAVAVSDDKGQSSNPTLAADVRASAISDKKAALSAEQQQHGIDFEFLRLPSQHNPCDLHRHPRLWKPHHRVYTRDPSCVFDDYEYYSDHGGERREAVSHLDILPGAEARETEKMKKPVAEPDPDRSLPADSDGERELQVASREPSSFADTDGHDGEAWKKGMLRKWLRYAYFHLHHGTGTAMPRRPRSFRQVEMRAAVK